MNCVIYLGYTVPFYLSSVSLKYMQKCFCRVLNTGMIHIIKDLEYLSCSISANGRALRWRGNSECPARLQKPVDLIYDQDKQKAERENVGPGLKQNRIV